MTENEIIRTVKTRLSEKRFRHTQGCVDMAEKLSVRWGADVALARRAAWLHDVTKELPYEKQLEIVAKSGDTLTPMQKSEKIIHAFSGAIVAREEFLECEDVCSAIRWHTTARSGMSILEKIIWISDLTEEGRSFNGVEKIRELAFSDISRALVLGFDTTLRVLLENGNQIDTNMIEARNSEVACAVWED